MKGPERKGENIKMINDPKYTSKNGKWSISHVVNEQGEHYLNVYENKKNKAIVIHMVKIHYIYENDIFWDGTIATKNQVILEISRTLRKALPKYVEKEMYKIAEEVRPRGQNHQPQNI